MPEPRILHRHNVGNFWGQHHNINYQCPEAALTCDRSIGLFGWLPIKVHSTGVIFQRNNREIPRLARRCCLLRHVQHNHAPTALSPTLHMNHASNQGYPISTASPRHDYEPYLYNFDSEFILRVGLQVVDHAVEICGIEVLVTRIVGVVRWCVAYHIVSIVCHKL